MKKAMLFARKYPLSLICFLTIWYLSFFHVPKTELDNVKFIDKWVHITMYGGSCTMVWLEYLRSHHQAIDKAKLFLLAWLAPIVMSGIIELLQEYCTNGRRSGDWLDLAANATGVTLAAIIGMTMVKLRKK